MRRVTASVLTDEFRTQVALSISSNFGENSLFKRASQPEIAKNSLKTHILGFRVVQGHRCWYTQIARQQCLLWYAEVCLSATVLLL